MPWAIYTLAELKSLMFTMESMLGAMLHALVLM
jgi:hypothetical protein